MAFGPFLSSTASPRFPAAVENLSLLLRANDAGDTAAAQRYAHEADTAFISAHNVAGALRARVELVFATHIAQEGADCLRSARSFRNFVENRSYTWLRIQFHLEEGTCYWLNGNMGTARSLYSLADTEAQQNAYKVLHMRAQDHLAALDGNTGNFGASWERLHNALDSYWNDTYPEMRGYNLYYNLHESARARRQPS